MILTAAERVLVHLHGSWNAREYGRETTQAGIAEGARILPSHVPRTLQSLLGEGLVEGKDTRLLGRTRRAKVYVLTEAGLRRARELLAAVDAQPVEVDGRRTSLGEARRVLGLAPLAALFAVDGEGHLAAVPSAIRPVALLQREDDLAYLRRWFAGGARVAVVYGSRGMGKTALARTFLPTVPRAVWLDLGPSATLPSLSSSILTASGVRAPDPSDPRSVAAALGGIFDTGAKLVVLDGYGEVPEDLVETLVATLRLLEGREDSKLLVLAQEATPAYCRFYARKEVAGGLVVERHLKGLDLEGTRALLGRPDIEEEALRQIYLLTKGCPLYLKYIREGDEAGLRANSRFTKAEIRLLLYSGRESGR